MTSTDAGSVAKGRADPAVSALRLITLGEGRLVRHDGAGEQVLYDGPTKSLALFAYLACAPGRGATRAHLQDLLWERHGTEGAQGALRTYLWKLRKLLGADAIVGDEYLLLAIPCDVDRDRLLEAADRGDAESVVAMYTGGFFPDFAQPDGQQFDLWVQSERLRLHGIFSRCAERVVSSAVDNGRFREALSVARRLRDTDPLNETGWRLLLNVLIVSGDTLNASNEAAVLERLLAADEREPLPA
ncbi:MAG: BTAD domain-containing putative transcriptional regulator, partial [Gemmatimonas sp.]